jgi:membrane protease YdiL (CAAX protease family)
MNNNETMAKNLTARGIHFLTILFCLLAVFLPDAFSVEISKGIEVPMRIGISIFFLVISIWLRGRDQFKGYWRVLFAFFIASTAMLIDWYFSQWAARALKIDPDSTIGYAIDKLESTLILVGLILIINKLSGANLASLYLKTGKVRQWFIIGLGTFCFFAGSSVWMAETLFKGRDLTWERILPWIPWLFLFVLANGLNEELLFRGLFLQKFEPFMGAIVSNLMITSVFVVWHLGADYTSDMLLFGVILFVLSFLWGFVMKKTDSIWGSVLFHAGADIPIMLGIFSTL